MAFPKLYFMTFSSLTSWVTDIGATWKLDLPYVQFYQLKNMHFSGIELRKLWAFKYISIYVHCWTEYIIRVLKFWIFESSINLFKVISFCSNDLDMIFMLGLLGQLACSLIQIMTYFISLFNTYNKHLISSSPRK